MSKMASFLSLILAFLGTYVYFTLRRTYKPASPLPPGPKPRFLIGNLLDMPRPGEKEWLHWAKHKDLYGTLFVSFRIKIEQY